MTISVHLCCQAADLALKLGRAEEAAALCRHVLAQHHWHLRAHLLLGQSYLEQQSWTEAARRFHFVQLVDPECAEAYSGLGIIALAKENLEELVRNLARAFENAPESDEAREALQQALSQQAGRPVPPPAFTAACVGRFYLRRGLPQPAAEAFAAALRDGPDRADLRLAYATALWQAGVREQAADICRPLLERNPRPLTALLITAAERFRQGEVAAGRQLWSQARAWDPDDGRARALFGEMPGLPLSPRPAEVPPPQDESLAELLMMAGHVGAEVTPPAGQAARELAAYARGLTSVSTKGVQPTDPELRHFQKTVQEVHDRLFEQEIPPQSRLPAPAMARRGRQPAEVILAWEGGLRDRFGAEGATQLEQAIQELCRAAEGRGVLSRLIYVDRPAYPELSRPDPKDAQQIKRFLDELDGRLEEEGLDFRHLLLIGGDALIPFARLPNPGEDTDETVPSDNLYASRDPTYLIPERAVGRIPDDGSRDPKALLEQLARATARLRGEIPPATSPAGCLGLVLPWMRLIQPTRKAPTTPHRRFGLSAQVWAEASEQVLQILPGDEPLRLCPPACRDTFTQDWLAQVPFAYFNLHGAADSPHWYGQRDLAQPGEGPLMPIAFSPQQVSAGQVDDIVVYSEACYGAHILGKNSQTSIALRFLAAGAMAVVGSTVISYGVSQPPLTDADLLGFLFWQHLLQGKTSGDALLQAKIDFTREMYRRQGYLDGDDMKTLLEFVLYGDPLATVGTFIPSTEAHAMAERIPMPPVLCEKHAKAVAIHSLSEDLVARVQRSLSWLQQGAQVHDVQVSLRSGCPADKCAGRCKAAEVRTSGPNPEALVFTTHREIEAEDGVHIPQVARVVVNARGRIIKMAVTR